MKALTVALTATSIALAGTSAYLWRQLEGERQKATFPQPKWNWDDPKARETELEWREQFNRRVLARATSILSSEQHRQITEIQTWQTSVQRQGMNRPQRPRGMRRDNPG